VGFEPTTSRLKVEVTLHLTTAGAENAAQSFALARVLLYHLSYLGAIEPL